MRRISEELLAIVRDDTPYTTNFSNTALLYMNRHTFNQVRLEFVSPDKWDDYQSGITQMLGIPIMLYHGVPIGRWDLVQRATGENILAGNMWADDPPNNRIYP